MSHEGRKIKPAPHGFGYTLYVVEAPKVISSLEFPVAGHTNI